MKHFHDASFPARLIAISFSGRNFRTPSTPQDYCTLLNFSHSCRVMM